MEAGPLGAQPPPQLLELAASKVAESLHASDRVGPDELPPGLQPLAFAPLGNYAMSVKWSDGHQSLLPYRSFVEGWEPYGPGD